MDGMAKRSHPSKSSRRVWTIAVGEVTGPAAAVGLDSGAVVAGGAVASGVAGLASAVVGAAIASLDGVSAGWPAPAQALDKSSIAANTDKDRGAIVSSLL